MFQEFTARLKPGSLSTWELDLSVRPFPPTSALLIWLPYCCVWAEATPYVFSLLVLPDGCVLLGLIADPPPT